MKGGSFHPAIPQAPGFPALPDRGDPAAAAPGTPPEPFPSVRQSAQTVSGRQGAAGTPFPPPLPPPATSSPRWCSPSTRHGPPARTNGPPPPSPPAKGPVTPKLLLLPATG